MVRLDNPHMVFDLADKRLSGFRHIDDRGLSSGRYRLKHVGRLPRQRTEIFIEAMRQGNQVRGKLEWLPGDLKDLAGLIVK